MAQALGHTQAFFRWAYDLGTHPRVLDAVEDILGPDILLWTVSIFPKYPRDPGYISWHQDGTYWGLDSVRVTTAWIALTDSTVDNGCMRVVPGSHRRPILPHRDTYAADNRLSRGQEIEVEVEERDAVDVVLRAGQMSLHHVNIIHGSNPNPSDGSRIGFAPRFTTPETRQIDGEPLTAVLARGRDRLGHFGLQPGAPVSASRRPSPPSRPRPANSSPRSGRRRDTTRLPLTATDRRRAGAGRSGAFEPRVDGVGSNPGIGSPSLGLHSGVCSGALSTVQSL